MSADRFSTVDDPRLSDAAGARLDIEQLRSEAGDAYPELEPVVSLAVETVAQAFDITDERDPALLSRLEATVAEGTVEAYAPLASTADVLARADSQAREARSAAVARSADLMATEVADTAAALRTKNGATDPDGGSEERGQDRSGSTSQAATRVTAAQGAALVHRAAQAKAAAREQEAAEVAAAAAKAASTLAASVKAEAAEVRHTVSDAASTVRSDALSSSYQVALGVGVEAAEQLQEYKVD